MLQFYKSLLQFYKKQENRPYTRLYGRFYLLRLSIYSSQSFRSEHCLRSRFAHSYITVISRIHFRKHLICLFPGPAIHLPADGQDQRGYARVCGRDVGSSWAVLSKKTRISVDARTRLLFWRRCFHKLPSIGWRCGRYVTLLHICSSVLRNNHQLCVRIINSCALSIQDIISCLSHAYAYWLVGCH